MRHLLPDPYILALLSTVALASFLPCTGNAALWFQNITTGAVSLLFFMHGAKLSGAALKAGLLHWRLHGAVFFTTFLLFPLLGIALKPLLLPLLTLDLYLGVLFLCVLPSAIQSSIAFTAMANGNVPAAITSASLSNLLGILLTPLWVGVLFHHSGGNGHAGEMVLAIFKQLLLPFVAGQLMRPWIGHWINQHRHLLKSVDQGSILLVVYTAFSAAVVQHLWEKTSPPLLLMLVMINAIILLLVLLSTYWAGKAFGFNHADRMTLLFCGSKKSLASGVPLASLLFAAPKVGLMLLPIMIFHTLQLMTCAVLAQRFSKQIFTKTTPATALPPLS